MPDGPVSTERRVGCVSSIYDARTDERSGDPWVSAVPGPPELVRIDRVHREMYARECGGLLPERPEGASRGWVECG